MRRELAEKITFMLGRYGVTDDGILNDIVILLNDYEVTVRETALTVRSEDRNMQLLQKFIISKTVKGCTERTIRLYATELKKILEAINKTVDDITADDIRYYLALRERRDGICKTTANNELRYMRSFFGWLHVEEMIPRNPTAKLDSIKVVKKKKQAFTELEVERIRNGCANAKEIAAVEVMLSTGCRVTELVSIKIEDIDSGKLIVHGKGEKDRMVYLNAKAQVALERYMKERKDKNPYMFPKMVSVVELKRKNDRCSYRYPENVIPDGHMDKSSVEAMMRRIGKRAGVAGVHPHRFRRTCATFALRRGMPIEQVSKMLGHEQISTTQIYLDMDETELEQAHKKYVI